jgi:tetratricopeptide (TPR) repeat protein
MASQLDGAARRGRSLLLAPILTALALAPAAVRAGDQEHLMQLLQTRSCPGCRLQDADLVHADLRDADLSGAQLQRANLSQARLDGARLGGADLSFTSLQGASLRGADLRGARLEGTDLRTSDLSGALLDDGGLARSHWQQARGMDPAVLGYADLHNAGVDAAQAGRYPEAERLFGEAIQRKPDAAISWLARGIARGQQGQNDLAANDLTYAARLYQEGGEQAQAEQLLEASQQLLKPTRPRQGGNGIGGQLLTGAAGLVQVLLPLAAKAYLPVGF